MWGKFQLFSLIASFLLYLADLGTDVYVGFQHAMNGDMVYFWLTLTFFALSIFLVNIYATTVLKTKWYKRILAFLTHSAMICLFVGEISRWKKENYGDKPHPCNSGKHFSECDCNECKKQLKESVKASLKMSHVRSIETFVESVPQWLLQVCIMANDKSYPWYSIVSVTISFSSLIFSIYSFEKNYWIRKIVEDRTNYIRPVSFPKRSAVVFFLWQTFLLLGRLSAIYLNMIAIRELIVYLFFFHWLIVTLALQYSVTKSDACSERCCKFLGLMGLSFFIFYPLLFHVSHSSVASLKKFIPGTNRISGTFKCVAVVLVPSLFFIFGCIGGVFAIVVSGQDQLFPYYIAIGSVFILAFFFEAIFYSSICNPLDVTSRKWGELQDRAGVERGRFNMS